MTLKVPKASRCKSGPAFSRSQGTASKAFSQFMSEARAARLKSTTSVVDADAFNRSQKPLLASSRSFFWIGSGPPSMVVISTCPSFMKLAT